MAHVYVDEHLVNYSESLDEFWALLELDSANFHLASNNDILTLSRTAKQVIQGQDRVKFCLWMNDLSRIVREIYYRGNPPILAFQTVDAQAKLIHPRDSDTLPNPDGVMAFENDGHWTSFEGTIYFQCDSPEATAVEDLLNAAAYSYFLLQARPDRVSVLGVYVVHNGMHLVIANTDGVMASPVLQMDNDEEINLLSAFLYRLFEPSPSMLDPTISRLHDIQNNRWVFDVTLHIDGEPIICSGCFLKRAGSSFASRGHVFINNNPESVNRSFVGVIKEWYSEPRYYPEAKILQYIHDKDRLGQYASANGVIPSIPGVIHLVHEEEVKWNNGETITCGNQIKTRIALKEIGTPFMDIRTPFEALIAIYDLLETTRLLHRHGVLHRDISPGNVLILADKPIGLPVSDDKIIQSLSCAAGASESSMAAFRSARYLMGITDDPHDTCNLLIDFGLSKLLDDQEDDKQCGTPRFMARSIRAGKVLGSLNSTVCYSAIPTLSDGTRAIYCQSYPDRVDFFGPDSSLSPDDLFFRIQKSPQDIQIDRGKEGIPPLQHTLCHDAESIFWLLVWWSLNATPAGEHAEPLPASVNIAFLDEMVDNRPLALKESFFSSAYAPLNSLLNTLSRYIEPDPFWVEDGPFAHPEYVHECFQRIVLNFIWNNKDKEYMHRPTSGQLRPGE